MTGNDIRAKFLNYFAGQGHRTVRSSSLVPANDPTLLFTNAGMNQFKEVFLGLEKRDYSRAASAQKCVRAGGKHNDLDNVGYTRRHHTFFEMLGNFSFGDYFKREAIAFAWELVTGPNWFAMPKDRLYITVFRDDDDAERLWRNVAGVPADRIFRLDEKDNFWQMGETGPCGPCSEIHYDLGPEAAEKGREHERFPLDGGGRYVEIWNLVFMQFDRANDGTLTPLPRPSIDTGMGLERVAAIMQGHLSNYETDLLRPVIDRAAELLNVDIHKEDERTDVALRINADHARATTFLIHDGVMPSNEGRGYVLRKIMRRAMRHGRLAGATEPYFAALTDFLAHLMKPGYPELEESIERVAGVVEREENRYADTFQIAERFFQDEAKSAINGVLPGAAAFKLYDTYGLAIDEQEEMARDFGLTIDRDGFTAEMEKQRSRARASWRGAEKAQIAEVYKNLPPAEFIGRESLEAPVEVAALIAEKKAVDLVEQGSAEIVFARTPFYAESGGQVGDTGRLLDPETREVIAEVKTAYKPTSSSAVQRIDVLRPIRKGDRLLAVVDPSRASTMRHHTATHLLHAALRQVLGTHVKQAGSVVEPGRLRFDFTHYAAMTPDELLEVERLVNQQILANMEVTTDLMDLEQALATGAMALFGEKYGDRVRVVTIPDFSRELCGGTHVRRTGDIGLFKIVYEGSISSGVRRIEAITGERALERFQEATAQLAQAGSLLHTSENGVVEQLEKTLERQKLLERQMDQLKTEVAHRQIQNLTGRKVDGATVIAEKLEGLDAKQLRTIADSLRNKFGNAVVVIASVNDGRISIVSAVSKDLTGKVQAGKLVSEVARAIGGKGGGRPDMAEGAGQNVSALPAALESVYEQVEALLSSMSRA